MGIHNVVIINLSPNGTLFGCDPDDPPFLTEPWWTIFSQVCDRARDIGMFIWFYDQIGFSGASYQAELAARHPDSMAQQLRIVSTEGAGLFHVQCPDAAIPIAAYLVPLKSPTEIKPHPLEAHMPAMTQKHQPDYPWCILSARATTSFRTPPVSAFSTPFTASSMPASHTISAKRSSAASRTNSPTSPPGATPSPRLSRSSPLPP